MFLSQLQEKAARQAIPWETLLKEAIQIYFLEIFFSFKEAAKTTFQGGTSIRLIHGGPRHSEDLDFVCIEPSSGWDKVFSAIPEKLKRLEQVLEGKLEVTTQNPQSKIRRWRLVWQSSRMHRKVFVRVEIAPFPARTREIKPLIRPENFPVSEWLAIPVETKEEILADKITAIAGRPYLKGRDFFDLWFLLSRDVQLDISLLQQKMGDYHVDHHALSDRTDQVDEELLRRDLSPFLPLSIREPLEREGYKSILKTTKKLLADARRRLR